MLRNNANTAMPEDKGENSKAEKREKKEARGHLKFTSKAEGEETPPPLYFRSTFLIFSNF